MSVTVDEGLYRYVGEGETEGDGEALDEYEG
jgi:hypothetical protein